MPPTLPNNQEIDQALKEFEAKNTAQNQNIFEASKSSPVPQKEVEGVKFEIPSYGAVKYYKETDAPKMVKLVMKWSGFKEQKTAEWILLGFVVVALGISFYLFFGGGNGGEKVSPMTPEQKSYMETGHGL
jgi:hypothetical protein